MLRKAKGVGAVVMVLIGLVALLVIGGMTLASGYNSLVSQDAQVELAESNVESQIKRRADLVPNLVNTVKGYAKHESQIYTDIAAARSRLLAADVGKNPQEAAAANQALTSSIGRLLAIAENYPALQANQNFIRLQDELTGTENRINYYRLQYNAAVKDYNQSVRSFPNNLLAGMFGFERREPFQTTEAERAVPTVNF